MSGYNVGKSASSFTPVSDYSTWIQQYKEQNIETQNDISVLTLVTPDDTVIFVGPSRLSMAGSGDSVTADQNVFYAVGMVSGFSYNETSSLQPMKSIGSRRHVFARTNAPVSGQISRMVLLGDNLYRALYALTDASGKLSSLNAKFAGNTDANTSGWYHNLEEDIFRIPFGLGFIYNSAATMMGGTNQAAGAEYLECCQLQSRAVSVQSGQALIMEQVTFLADRVIPWPAYAGPSFDVSNPGDIANTVANDIG